MIRKIIYISIITLLFSATVANAGATGSEDLNSKSNQQEFQIYATNKVNIVLNMGKLFKEGKFDSLFDLVGQINQSDPLQVYLKESEKIFKARLIQESLDLDNLYSLAISQILQKNPEAAISTIGIINNLDPANANAYLAKAIAYLYQFKPRLAHVNLEKASTLNKDESLLDIISTLKRLTGILSLDFANIYQLI